MHYFTTLLRATLVFFLLLCLLNPFVSVNAQVQNTINEHYKKAEAFKAQANYPKYLFHLKQIDSIRPYHPVIVKKSIEAGILNKNWAYSLSQTKVMLQMDIGFSPEKDSVFSSFWDKNKEQIDAWKKEYGSDIQKASVLFTISNANNHIEGISKNQKQNRWYVGSVNKNQILVYAQNNLVDSITYKDIPLASVMGMAVHPKTGNLWVCSTHVSDISSLHPTDSSNNAVLVIDPIHKKLLRRFQLPSDAFAGDLIFNQQGIAFVSDSKRNCIYTIDSELKLLVSLDKWGYSLQGLAFNSKETTLFFADYITGIHAIDLKTKKIQKLKNQTDHIEKGLDGLYFYKQSLVAIQNGTYPKRILRFSLDNNQSILKNATILERSQKNWVEPTLGTISGQALIFVADSLWPLYKDGKLPASLTAPIKIMSLPLE